MSLVRDEKQLPKILFQTECFRFTQVCDFNKKSPANKKCFVLEYTANKDALGKRVWELEDEVPFAFTQELGAYLLGLK